MTIDTGKHLRKHILITNARAKWQKRFDAVYYMIRFYRTRSMRGWHIMTMFNRSK